MTISATVGRKKGVREHLQNLVSDGALGLRDGLSAPQEYVGGRFERAVKLAVERSLHADREHDAEHLHLHRAAHRIKTSRRPRQNLVAAIHAEEVLDLLGRREMPPSLRQVGDTRHARIRNYSAIVETDALFARSFERRACHRLGYVARTRYGGKAPRARV
jgi:hypothetical protein